MIEWNVVPIDMGQGVDTKTDPKKIASGKFLRLENGVFTRPNRIEKRNGYLAINGLSHTAMVHSYNEELIAADQNQILSYSPTGDKWVSRGAYTSVELSQSTIDQEHPTSGYVDSAVVGNYALYVWSTPVNIGSATTPVAQLYATVVDLSTGTVIYGPTSLNAASNNSYFQPVKCVVLGGTTLAVLYLNNPGNNIGIRTFSIVSGSVTVSNATNINFSPSDVRFDVVGTTKGGVLAYIGSGGGSVNIVTISTAGASVNTKTFVVADSAAPIHVSLGSDPMGGGASSPDIWVYFATFTGPVANPATSTIQYLVVDYTLAITRVAPTQIVSFPAQNGTRFITSNISSVLNADLTQNIYYGYYIEAGLVQSFVDITYTTNVTVTGVVGSQNLYSQGVIPYSRTFKITQFGQTISYAFFAYRGTGTRNGGSLASGPDQISPKNQPTLFLLSLQTNFPTIPTPRTPVVIARFAFGLENIQSLISPYVSNGNGVVSYIPNVNIINPLDPLKVLFAYAKNIQEFRTDVFSFFGTGSNLGALSTAFSSTFDFGSPNTYVAANAGELAVLNGSVLQAYDGQTVSELNFHLSPEILFLDPSNNAPVAPATGIAPIGANNLYSYLAIFQWTDAQGNLHQSAPSFAANINITQASTFNTVDIYVTTNYLSQKSGVSVAIYRTQSNGSIYYLVTDPLYLINADTPFSAIIYRDQFSDSQIIGNPQAYTYPGSAVLENSTPPPSIIMLNHNNRLWFVDSENPNSIWYTKSFESLVGLSPSAFLLEQIDEKFGNISSLSEMDEKLVIFKQAGVFIQSGDGANDVGSNSTLSFPQFVPSDVGCDNQKSVVLTPQGIMFHSANGIYILSRALQVAYLGMEVEQYNSQVITSALLIKGKSQIRFLCSSGLTLVYDYIFKHWSTFTNHTGISATIYGGTYTYTNGIFLFKEIIPNIITPANYTDAGNPFALLLQTGWLEISSVQNFQRVRRFISLGDFVNGASTSHGISVAAAYDFSTTFQQSIPYLFGAASASGKFQYRERLPIQKCDSISLLITEITTGDSAEFIDLVNMSFEAGLKKGVNKLGAAQSVG